MQASVAERPKTTAITTLDASKMGVVERVGGREKNRARTLQLLCAD